MLEIDKKDETGVTLKGRLLRISFIKVDCETVWQQATSEHSKPAEHNKPAQPEMILMQLNTPIRRTTKVPNFESLEPFLQLNRFYQRIPAPIIRQSSGFSSLMDFTYSFHCSLFMSLSFSFTSLCN